MTYGPIEEPGASDIAGRIVAYGDWPECADATVLPGLDGRQAQLSAASDPLQSAALRVTLAPGSRLGPYEVLAPIGIGGMGEVYRARDTRPSTAREVAIKLVTTPSSDETSLRRFEQEARATCAATHPNILAIYDVGMHDGRVYLVEELVDGVTLRVALSGGALPVRRAMDIGRTLAQGLAAVHAKGMVRRDLKPENVVLNWGSTLPTIR